VYLLVFTHNFTGILICKGLTVRLLYNSFGIKGLIASTCFDHFFAHHQEVLHVQQLVYLYAKATSRRYTHILLNIQYFLMMGKKCSKHVEVINLNKLKANGASCLSYILIY
jgi:hypothetical protein